MKITPIKTPIIKKNDDLPQIIIDELNKQKIVIPNKSILVITSKVVSYWQGKMVARPITGDDRDFKHQLVRQEADWYLEPSASAYDILITIKNNNLAVNAGIDESNAQDDVFLLWPENLQATTNDLWSELRASLGIKNFGIIITDSKTFPLKWGVIGTAMAHCGFVALNSHIGETDLFGREMKMSQVNVSEALACAAVFEMGEVDQQTPLCLIQDLEKVVFQNRPPTKHELEKMMINKQDDVYAPLLNSTQWQRGEKNKGGEKA